MKKEFYVIELENGEFLSIYQKSINEIIVYSYGPDRIDLADLMRKEIAEKIYNELKGQETERVYELAENTRDFSHEMNRLRTRCVF